MFEISILNPFDVMFNVFGLYSISECAVWCRCVQAAMGGGMGVVGPGAGPRAGAGPGAHARQAAALDAFQARVAPQLIEAVQQGASVQQLAEVLQIPENQAAELMQGVQEGVLVLALLHFAHHLLL